MVNCRKEQPHPKKHWHGRDQHQRRDDRDRSRDAADLRPSPETARKGSLGLVIGKVLKIDIGHDFHLARYPASGLRTV